MKILFLSSNIPHHRHLGGEYLRTANQVREMVRRGHTVRVLCLRPDDQPESLADEVASELGITIEHFPRRWSRHLPWDRRAWRRACATLTGRHVDELAYHPAVGMRLEQVCTEFSPDVVHADSYAMGVYACHLSGRPSVWFLADSAVLAAERQMDPAGGTLRCLRTRLARDDNRRYESRWASRFGSIFFVADADREIFLRDHPAHDVRVAANGVRLDRLPLLPGDRPVEPGALLFTGNLGAPHNCDAVLFFLRDVWPLVRERIPAARYYAVGANPPRALQAWHDSGRVHVTGFVPSLLPYFERASVYVCTVVNGAGMLNKLQEAIALGLPVVCTRMAADGLRLVDQEHVIVADDPPAIVAGVEAVLANPTAARRRALRARAFLEREYTWAAHVDKLERAYDDLQTRARS